MPKCSLENCINFFMYKKVNKYLKCSTDVNLNLTKKK